MRILLFTCIRTFCLLLLFFGMETATSFHVVKKAESFVREKNKPFTEKKMIPDSVEILAGTFLGNDQRDYYGDFADSSLNVIWKTFLGKGTTIVTAKKGVEEWFGAGWTGQPLVVKEKNKIYLIQGCYDHHLKKIDAANGNVIWEYAYDDIIKGTGTIWKNDSAADPQNRIVILQGSRLGVQNSMASPDVASLRAVSYFTGKELWRMNVKHTASYSRDCDASALLFHDTAYIGLEDGIFTVFDPGKKIIPADTINRPQIFEEEKLYTDADCVHHGGNLVTESSPARIGNHIYITAGSGHVYGYDITTKKLDWDFYIGSDLDGSPVVTSDSCILVPVEKQYIAGNGGVFKLDPRKDPSHCVVWYFPTGDLDFASWQGGVVGSPAVNDHYNDGSFPKLAAFSGIDGFLDVVQYDKVRTDTLVYGPDAKTKFPAPQLLFRSHVGSSISTPIFTKGKLIAAGYSGIHIFSFDADKNFHLCAFHPGTFESTPVVNEGKIYVASRDGYLYCFGNGTVVSPADSNDNKITAVSTDRATVPVVSPATAKNPTAIVAVKPKPNIAQHAPQNNVRDDQFYLVAGVFKSEDNARNFAASLKNRNLDATILDVGGELHYVSVAQASSKDELMNKWAKINDAAVDHAWIFHR